MRKHIYNLIYGYNSNRKSSLVYDWFIMLVAILSVVPMMFRDNSALIFQIIESMTVYVLFFDYILRWITNDYKMKHNSAWAFFIYPLTPLAIMDILGILPSLGLLPSSLMVLRLLRLVKLFQYSKSCRRIINVFRKQGRTLLSVFIIAAAYIFISALIMFVYEPAENFANFFDALYWATTALTTVGYGDIYPCTDVGKFISMLSSLFGVAVIAMPAGIVTAGFLEELNNDLKKSKEKHIEKLIEEEKSDDK